MYYGKKIKRKEKKMVERRWLIVEGEEKKVREVIDVR